MTQITPSLGFVTVKPLEVLLSRDDVTLFDVLDDRTLFDECKDKNPKIIEYLSSTKILRQLLGFALGDFADPTVNKPKSVRAGNGEIWMELLIIVLYLSLK